MPQIFDNIERDLLPALRDAIGVSHRGDFCVGYFNLRGWSRLAPLIDNWPGGDDQCCRLLIGMHRSPRELVESAQSLAVQSDRIDNQTAAGLKNQLAQEFRRQLTIGAPTDDDEVGLRRLAAQLTAAGRGSSRCAESCQAIGCCVLPGRPQPRLLIASAAARDGGGCPKTGGTR